MGLGDKISLNVCFQFSNGRQLHGHFSIANKTFNNMFGFLKEIRNSFGSIVVFSYKGFGNFLVHVFDDNASEIQFSQLRTISRAPVINQGFMLSISPKMVSKFISYIIFFWYLYLLTKLQIIIVVLD